MEDLVVYRSRIGLFNGVVCSKALKSSSKKISRPLKPSTPKQDSEPHKTVDDSVSCNIPVQPPNHPQRILVYLLWVSAICWIEACGRPFNITSGSDLEYTVWTDHSLPSYHGTFIADHKDDRRDGHGCTPNYFADQKDDKNYGHTNLNEMVSYKFMWNVYRQNYKADMKDDQNDGHTFKTVSFMEMMDKPGQNKSAHDGQLAEKGLQTGICLPVSDQDVCTYMLVCRTCAYLLGNKGVHMSNGNPRARGAEGDPGEAVLRPNVLNVIREGVDVSVGFVRLPRSSGTGFRVGQDKFMTAYHVLREEIDILVQEILFHLEIRSEEAVRDLISRLNVPIQRNNQEPLNQMLKRAVIKFIDDSATNIPLLIQRLEGFTDTEALSQHLTTRWKENCTVDFVNHEKFSIDWRIQFGEKNRDIVIVKLLETRTGQDFPRALLLDGNYRQHGNIHVVRYVNQANQPQVVVDQATQVLQNDEEAQRQVTEAVEWWKDKLPDEDEDYFRRAYADCCTAVNDDTGRVILRASESFTPGSSGSPVVYLFNPDNIPAVTLIYQGGYPEFYYNAQERFEQIDVNSKCFFERGTTMKKVAELLTQYGKTDLKEEIFRQPAAPREDNLRRDMTMVTADLRRDMGDMTQATADLRRDMTLATADLRRDMGGMTLATADLRRDMGDMTLATADLRRDINSAAAGLARDVGNLQLQQTAMGDDMRTLREEMDTLAEYASGFGAAETVYSRDTAETLYRRDTAASSPNKMPSVDMEASVKVWRSNDKLCYETKGIKDVVQKICSDEHSYICVVGEPGCGKSTAIRHAALYLKDKLGFIIYPVSGPKQFIDYLDPDKTQVFIYDDFCGEYFIDQDKLKAWGEYSEKIKDCLQVHKNTKVLFSLRVQLYSELKSKGNTRIYNDQRHVINFSDKEYKLNRDTMQDMLRHYLQVHHVQNIEGLIRRVRWEEAKQFAGCFPLLCKVFSEDESVRVDPKKYFRDPLPALQNIFKRIKSDNKHQFCGLLLCGVTDLKDEYFSPLSELNKPKHFNLLIKSQKLDPDTDLDDIKQALNNLDGVYISHIGNRYTFLHSIFQNIVTFLYDDKYYVFKYATLDFIHTRVRLFSKFDTDDDYVKVFYGDDCVELLVDRMIEELRSDDRDRLGEGVLFIVNSHYIDNKKLFTCLMEKLFDSKHTQITQNMIDQLFGLCLVTVCWYKPLPPHTDVTSCPQYQLLLSLIARCDCNKQIEGLGWYPLLLSVECGSLPVTKVLVEHQADVNVVDSDDKRCVLHKAVDCTNNVDFTKYLLSLPNLKCLNHRDRDGHTPYWYVVNNKSPRSWYVVVRHRDELSKLYKHKAAICE